jgi:hypothetical protein
MHRHKTLKGFTTLFAVLVASLLLAVGLVIFDITFKELAFSSIVRDSSFAVYAADGGIECALFWDLKAVHSVNFGSGSVFSTSTSSQSPTSGVYCNGQDVAAAPWATQISASSATTTFTLLYPPKSYCAIVTVIKWGTPLHTSIVSRGYNTCESGASNRIERAIQANY